MDKNVRLLVVGGTGFIGSHIVQRALELDWNVTSVSLRPSSKQELSKVELITADLTDPGTLKSLLSGRQFDYVVNCGGYINHELFFDGGAKVFDTHFSGLLNLLDCIDRDKLKRFVNIGSSDEYGSAQAPQIESFREAPISPYSMAKTAATHFLQMLYRTESIPTVTLRLFLTYGPGQNNARFLPQIIQGCLEGRDFPTSLGEQLRDFLYIQDTVDAVMTALENDAASGEVFNIASGKPVTIRQVIETVQRQIGSGEPRFGEVPYRPGENMVLYADVSKAKKILQWQPAVSLEDGIYRTIEWFKGIT